MTSHERLAVAALTTLIILQIVMLTALYTKTPPHPPTTTPLFAIAPFLAMSLSVAVAAIILGPVQTTVGKVLALAAAALALVSFGPQKFLDAQFPLIWPAVISGQIAVLALIVSFVQSNRSAPNTLAQSPSP